MSKLNRDVWAQPTPRPRVGTVTYAALPTSDADLRGPVRPERRRWGASFGVMPSAPPVSKWTRAGVRSADWVLSRKQAHADETRRRIGEGATRRPKSIARRYLILRRVPFDVGSVATGGLLGHVGR
jgi:hypothetical protein